MRLCNSQAAAMAGMEQLDSSCLPWDPFDPWNPYTYTNVQCSRIALKGHAQTPTHTAQPPEENLKIVAPPRRPFDRPLILLLL